MKNIIYILLLFSLNINAQYDGYSVDQQVENLSNLTMDLSIGNQCETEFNIIELPEDFNMNFNTIELMYVHLKVGGNIVNEGTILYNCNASIFEVFGGTLSTSDDDFSKLKIFPNPAIDEINIKGVNVNELELFDMYGRLLKHFKTFGLNHKIMIDDLAGGVYFLRINGIETKKIVKR